MLYTVVSCTQPNWMLHPCWNAGRQSWGPTCEHASQSLHTLPSSNRIGVMSCLYRAMQGSQTLQFIPLNNRHDYVKINRCVSKRCWEGSLWEHCSKLQQTKGLWIEAESWQCSKYLSQVPLSTRWKFSSRATDYVKQPKGTEESMVLNQDSSEKDLPFPIQEFTQLPGEQEALWPLHACRIEASSQS